MVFSGLLLIAGLLIAVSTGAKNIKLSTIWDSIFYYEDVLEMQLVRDIRIPRAICSLIAGGILGITGAMMQGVSRNPIAEPSIMGISQGATLAIAILYAKESLAGVMGNMAAAFLGALVSGLLVLAFSIKNARNMNMARVLLAGTALSTFFVSLACAIALLSNKSQFLAFWISGGFRTATWSSVLLLTIVGLLGIVGSIYLAQKINIVSLGEDIAVGLGVNPIKIRVLTFLLIIPLCAGVVAIAGNIGFVGLIIPQIARKLVGQDYRKIIPCSFVFGSVLLVFADILARLVNIPYETPIGLFTAIIGVPFFIIQVRKERG